MAGGAAGIMAGIQQASEQELRFRTFHNYVRGWTEHLSAAGISVPADVSTAMRSVPTRNSNPARTDQQTQGHFNRGALTLRLMKAVTQVGNPSLSSVACLWLPVQAYYAVHAFGCAALSATNQQVPKTHAACIHSLGAVIRRHFPAPLAAEVAWDSQSADLNLSGLSVSATATRQHHVLATVSAANAELTVAKSLTTTYMKKFKDEALPAARDRLKRKKLTVVHKDDAHRRLGYIGLTDFLYRLRRRSNYEAPDAFIHPLRSPWDADRFCNDLVSLVDLVTEGFRVTTAAALGPGQYKKVATAVP